VSIRHAYSLNSPEGNSDMIGTGTEGMSAEKAWLSV